MKKIIKVKKKVISSKKKKQKVKITKKLTFAEIIDKNPDAAKKLAELGLFCGGCPMAQFETIGNGAIAHGLDPNELIKKLNK